MISTALQHPSDLLRVVIVHLAAKRLDEERLPCRASARALGLLPQISLGPAAQRQWQRCVAHFALCHRNTARETLHTDIELLLHGSCQSLTRSMYSGGSASHGKLLVLAGFLTRNLRALL